MGKVEKQQPRPRHSHLPPPEIEVVEAIATCSCSHSLESHSADGCITEECECEIERGMLLVGKIQAIDQL